MCDVCLIPAIAPSDATYYDTFASEHLATALFTKVTVTMTLRFAALGMILGALVSPVAEGSAATARAISTIDLSKPFATRSPWRFTATQGEDVEGLSGEEAPGPVSLCISNNNGQSCRPDADDILTPEDGKDAFSEPHVLGNVALVHPSDTTTLLLVEIGSFSAMNGDRRVATQLFGYDRGRDVFTRVYAHVTRKNNNQEIRYIAKGVLRGFVISAEPTSDAPFGFWIIVNRSVASGVYKQVLRYRSATTYGDGNRLAVIDSEMPGIQRRLGLWRVGQPLPLPQSGCANPHMLHGALRC